MRNAMAHAPAKQRGAVAAMLKTIFAQESKAEAVAQWGAVADALREKQPKFATLMDGSRERWPQIASANPLERFNKEIRRRSEVVGVFPDDEAIVRLVGALMPETNDEWTVARRQMGLESLAHITDAPNHRPPAVAA